MTKSRGTQIQRASSRRAAARAAPFDPRWLKARRALLSRYKRQARALEGPEPPDLRDYRASHARSCARSRWTVSSRADLLESLAGVDAALAGDFHSLPQAQRAHLRVLRGLPARRPVTLALECFRKGSEPWLARWLENKISLKELRRKTRWDADWGFPWEGYAQLLELARARGWKVAPLSPGARSSAAKSLASRDQFAAAAIAREVKNGPRDALVYALIGELHLAGPHLPRELEIAGRRALGRDIEATRVHLNSEKAYFALARAGRESTAEAVRYGPKQFGLIATPPWVQWQAHWLHLSRTAEEGLDSGGDGYDFGDHVTELVRVAAADLGVEREMASAGALDGEFTVYSSQDDRVWAWLARARPRGDRDVAAALVAEGRSFFWPSQNVFYLARSTINHASELAGQYVHAKLSGRAKPLWTMPRDFEAAVWRDAAGFFVSKLMNPQRRGETLADARGRLAALRPTDRGREALLLALDRRIRELVAAEGLDEPSGRRGFRPRRKSSWREAARILGAMMGERLYAAYRSRSIELKGIVELLRTDVDGPGFARREYPDLVRRLGPRFDSGHASGPDRRPLKDKKRKRL